MSVIKSVLALKYRLLNFLIPNFKKIISKRVIFGTIPSCQQKTLITGKGIVNIGGHCQFGYKPGGFHRKGCIEMQPRFLKSTIKIGNQVLTNNNIFICAAH